MDIIGIIKKQGVDKLEEKLRGKEVIRGGDLVYLFTKNYNINERDSEELIKILMGADAIKTINKLTNLTDDLFKINKDLLFKTIIDGPNYPSEEFESDKKNTDLIDIDLPGSKTESFTTPITSDLQIICVISAPPYIDFNFKKNNCLSLKDAFGNLIITSKAELNIMSPFIDKYGISQYIYELVYAAKRGVNINLLTRELGGDNGRGIQYLYNTFKAERLTDKLQIKIFQISPDNSIYNIHAKMVIVDKTNGYIGSGELRGNSINGLVETGVILPRPLIDNYIEIFDLVWRKSISYNIQ